MMLKQRWVTIVFLLSSCVAATLQAQSLLPTDWPTPFRDAANTSSTSVAPPADLSIEWEVPADGSRPLVYLTNTGQHLLITGRLIYDASTGELLATLPHPPGDYAGTEDTWEFSAVTSTADASGVTRDVLLTSRCGENECQLYAYDLLDVSQPLWQVGFNGEWCFGITAKDGLFYVLGGGSFGSSSVYVLALDPLTGLELWQSPQTKWGIDGTLLPGDCEIQTPAIATVTDEFSGSTLDLIFVHLVNVNSCWAGPLVALDVSDVSSGKMCWVRSDIDLREVAVDEEAGVVFVEDDWNALMALDALTGNTIWSTPLDACLNGPPTLGWAMAEDAGPEAPSLPAVFVVEGADVKRVSAFDRLSGETHWRTQLPQKAWTSAVFCGDDHSGRLYVASNDGDTYVFDAMNGALLQTLATNVHRNYPLPSPVIVEVDGEVTMFCVTLLDYPGGPPGDIVAWNASGDLYPPIYQPNIVATPAEVQPNSLAQISVTLTDGWNSQPLAGEEIQFSCDAGRFEGEVLPVDDTTDANGVATTTYYSDKRECVVTITATTSDGTQVQTTVTVSKSVPDDPPPATETGTIQGTVYSGGKPARKVPVQLLQDDATIRQTTTNPQGKYTFDAVPTRDYVVKADDGGLSGSEPVTVEAGATVTQDIVLQ